MEGLFCEDGTSSSPCFFRAPRNGGSAVERSTTYHMSVVRDPPTVDFLFCFAICVWIVVSLFLPLFPVESIASLSLSIYIYIYVS